MTLVYDARCLIFKVAGMGPYDNNGYVIADPSTKEAYLVDAPAEMERLLNEAVDFRVKGVIVTHTHPDHGRRIRGPEAPDGPPRRCA